MARAAKALIWLAEFGRILWIAEYGRIRQNTAKYGNIAGASTVAA